MKTFVIIIVLILIFSPMVIFGIYRAKKNREVAGILNEFSRLRNEELAILEEMTNLKKKHELSPVADYQNQMDRLEEKRKEISEKQEKIARMVGERNV